MIQIIKLNKTEHQDILLNIDEINLNQLADSYYFAIDNFFNAQNYSTDQKVVKNINSLLQHWINTVKVLPANQVTFLPFDFSDQYLGCLKVKKISTNDDLLISYGYTIKFNGSNIAPSKLADFVISEKDFNPQTNEYTVNQDQFAYEINKSISGLSSETKSKDYLN